MIVFGACDKAEPPQPEPTPAPVPIIVDASVEPGCDVIIGVTQRGWWVSGPPNLRCYAPVINDLKDREWLDQQLLWIAQQIPARCEPHLEIVKLEPFVKYEHVTMALQAAMAAGLVGGTIVEAHQTSRRFGTPSISHCAPPPRTVVVTKHDIRIDNLVIVEIANLPPGNEPIGALVDALGKGTTVIVRAEGSTDARIINRIVVTAKNAGFPSVRFVVTP